MILNPRPALSVVIPVYGCTPALEELYRRLTDVLGGLVESYEIIFVDDRGPDDPWPILTRLAQHDPRVRPFRMSRNYGQQIAITAGLQECRGEYAVVMDCDLQDPPEVIPALWATAQSGVAIVYAKRQAGEPRLRKLANRLYFFLMDKIVGYKVDPEQGSFSLIARRVIDGYLRFEERERHYLFILRWLGFDSVDVMYARDKRAHGQSGYTFHKLVKHAIEGIFFQSTRFLVWILWLGLATSAVSFVTIFFLILSALAGNPPKGWTSLAIVELLTSGIILIALGGTGLYIARIFENSKRRPLYVFDPGPSPTVSEPASTNIVQTASYTKQREG